MKKYEEHVILVDLYEEELCEEKDAGIAFGLE